MNIYTGHISLKEILGGKSLIEISSSKKRIRIGDKYYRQRRGEWVEIPEKWVGKVTDPQTIRKRKSKRGQGKSFRAKVQRKKRKDR